MTERTLSDEFLEKLIIKAMLKDSQYTATLSSVFDPEYFQDKNVSKIFKVIIDHYKSYNDLIPTSAIINSFKSEDDQEKINNVFKETNSIDFDIAKNCDFLFNETNQYLKEQAFKDALIKGVNLVENKKNPLEYKNIIEEALAKDLKVDLGLDYWGQLNERLKRVLDNTQQRVPSFFPILDEFLAMGFPAYTLNVILSRIHGFKTNILVNMASRQVLQGYNPLILTLEMGEDALAQRLDSIYSKLDINRIYLDKSYTRQMIKSLKNIKNTDGLGTLYIKEFPTGKASVNDFEAYIKELNYRGIYPNPIYCDYLQIVGSVMKNKNRHEDISDISKSLRALGWKYDVPIISVGQLNRSGMMIDFDEVDFTFVGEGISISADCDFMAIFGKDESSLIYESEIHYKLVKNRLGGRVGEIGKFYIDKKSLKMYDESELDLWIEDAKQTGDSRKINS